MGDVNSRCVVSTFLGFPRVTLFLYRHLMCGHFYLLLMIGVVFCLRLKIEFQLSYFLSAFLRRVVKGTRFKPELSCTYSLRLLFVKIVVVFALARLFQETVGVKLSFEWVMRLLALVNVFVIEFRAHFFTVVEHLCRQVGLCGRDNHLENEVEDLGRDFTSFLELAAYCWILTQLLLFFDQLIT